MADENTNVIRVRMTVPPSGRGEDSQWFDYRPSFFGEIIRVEWDLDSDEATLQSDVAEYLINHSYAVRLSPEVEPAPIVIVEEPLVVETEPQSGEPPSPMPLTAPPAAETSPASSGGKQRKKENRK
jgi:hypothetical protein